MSRMFRPLSLFIGLRYARSRRRNHFVSFISAVSILGISLGVAALIAVVAVMNGFEREVRARVLGMVAHATITAPGGRVKEWRELAAAARRHPEVIGVAPFVNYGAMMVEGAKVTGVLVWGISPEEEASVSDLQSMMERGELSSEELPDLQRTTPGHAISLRLENG